jgi:hypothetical protein
MLGLLGVAFVFVLFLKGRLPRGARDIVASEASPAEKGQPAKVPLGPISSTGEVPTRLELSTDAAVDLEF